MRDRTSFVRPLKEAKNRCIDPILLLLVHALRQGLFADGNTLDEIMTTPGQSHSMEVL